MNNRSQSNYLVLHLILSTGIIAFLLFSSFSDQSKSVRFEEITAERINIVEKDGTVKLLITNKNRFPAGKEAVNGKNINSNRPKFPGILFYNEAGTECGGLIYDGVKSANGHDAGMSLTFDQFDSDQVIQLLYSDTKNGTQHIKESGLIFSERRDDITNDIFTSTLDEWRVIADPGEKARRMQELQDNGFFGRKRIYLGIKENKSNGLFLYDAKGKPKILLYVDEKNNPVLEFFNDEGKIIDKFPK